MKIFLSWSGERSRLAAAALRDWLPQVINAVEPFMSSDIDAGARWQSEIAKELEDAAFGILCITAENQHSPWLNFEAGALAKAVDASRVVPLAIGLTPAEIRNPLGQFQSQMLTKKGMGKIVLTINLALPKPLPNERMEKALGKWWPDLEAEIQAIEQRLRHAPSTKERRSMEDMVEEILDTVRDIARNPAVNTVRSTGPRGYSLSELAMLWASADERLANDQKEWESARDAARRALDTIGNLSPMERNELRNLMDTWTRLNKLDDNGGDHSLTASPVSTD